MRGLLVVFAREPRPGRVKTRMSPPLSPEQAAELYAAMLDDVLEASAGMAAALELEPWVAVTPASAVAAIAHRAPPPFRCVAQVGADLGARMSWAVREGAATGGDAVLLRGSDSPALGLGTLHHALAELEGCELVIRPDRDGGYDLIGLRQPVPGLFDHPMSTRTVLADTLGNARARGVPARVLPPGFDLDRAEDLRWLAGARRADPALPCPRTLRYLDEHDLWRHAPGLAPA